MIVTPQEYNSLISRLVDQNNFINMLRVPKDEIVYKIDLNERKIYAPEFLSVEEDHNAEIIWFEADRFYDDFDLYSSTCLIQYINAKKEEYYYAAPICSSTIHENGKEKIYIPWVISGEVAAKTGIVQFSFLFFKLNENKDQFYYMLNTQVAKSKILVGMRSDPTKFLEDDTANDEEFIPQRKWLSDQIIRLEESYRELSQAYALNWRHIT